LHACNGVKVIVKDRFWLLCEKKKRRRYGCHYVHAIESGDKRNRWLRRNNMYCPFYFCMRVRGVCGKGRREYCCISTTTCIHLEGWSERVLSSEK
jgi:hypothetical protein